MYMTILYITFALFDNPLKQQQQQWYLALIDILVLDGKYYKFSRLDLILLHNIDETIKDNKNERISPSVPDTIHRCSKSNGLIWCVYFKPSFLITFYVNDAHTNNTTNQNVIWTINGVGLIEMKQNLKISVALKRKKNNKTK